MKRVLACLLLAAAGCAVKQKRQPAERDYRPEAEKASAKGCANLTVVLDNWKFAILSQTKNMLLFDHHTVLPDYARIASLSGALDELHAEFKALKERLGELTARFEGVEAFVDQLSAARRHGPRPAKRRRVLTQPAWP